MNGVLSVACVCLVLGVVNTDASQVLSAPLYLAKYASSYNSHVVNHDVRYPVVAAPVLAPAVQPLAIQAPVITSQFVAAPVAPVSRLVSPNIPVVPQLPAAPLNLPVTPQLRAAPQLSAVEVTARSGAQKSPSPNSPLPEQLSRSTQVNNEPNAAPKANPVPNSILAASQFLARQFSQQQQPQQQQLSARSSAEIPQPPAAKPRFLAARNGEKFNNDDSESVEINSAESVEVPSVPSGPKLQPAAPVEAPRARIVFSPVSVLKSQILPSPYTQLISF